MSGGLYFIVHSERVLVVRNGHRVGFQGWPAKLVHKASLGDWPGRLLLVHGQKFFKKCYIVHIITKDLDERNTG